MFKRFSTKIACLSLLACAQLITAAERPNVVFILADDWGWGDMSMHGHPVIKTPNLDQLAREGTEFLQFNTNSPVCSPSRAAIMTGRFPSTFGLHHVFGGKWEGLPDWLDYDLVMMPRLFQESGYRTAHYGKWHLSGHYDGRRKNNPPEPALYGYDDTAVYVGSGPQLSKTTPHPAEYTEALAAGMDIKEYAIRAELIVDRAIQFIGEQPDEPFFLNLWIQEGHAPYTPLPSQLEPYNHWPNEPERIYYATIGNADAQLGRLFDYLDEKGLAENTIVIFTSDNGPEVPLMHDKRSNRFESRGSTGGYRGRKRSLFEGGVRTPFIVRWPKEIPANEHNKETVITGVDMLPTLAAAAGISLPDGYESDGENMLEAFKGSGQMRTKPIYNSYLFTYENVPWYKLIDKIYRPEDWQQLSIRDGDFKLVHSMKLNRTALFNVVEDPYEKVNLAPKYPEKKTSMLEEILAWKDTLPMEPDPKCKY